MSTRAVPVSVVVMTKNEEANLPKCLASVERFDEVFVVDSQSDDRTQEIARAAGAEVVEFVWNGRYPKKKQWCLENLPFRHDFVLYLDADEELTAPLVDEIARPCGARLRPGGILRRLRLRLPRTAASARPSRVQARPLRSASRAVRRARRPRRREHVGGRGALSADDRRTVGTLRARMIHRDQAGLYHYFERHNRYSDWEAALRSRGGIGRDDETQTARRSRLKRAFAKMPFRPLGIFVYSYVLTGGFLDGRAGFPLRRVPWLLLLADRAEDARAKSSGGVAVTRSGATST